jgi:hypothetical protein
VNVVPTEQITNERLERWKAKMSASHATPLVLVGVGHDHLSGQLVVCTLEEPDLSNARVRELLVWAIRHL